MLNPPLPNTALQTTEPYKRLHLLPNRLNVMGLCAVAFPKPREISSAWTVHSRLWLVACSRRYLSPCFALFASLRFTASHHQFSVFDTTKCQTHAVSWRAVDQSRWQPSSAHGQQVFDSLEPRLYHYHPANHRSLMLSLILSP